MLILTSAIISGMLGVGAETVRRWIRNGELGAERGRGRDGNAVSVEDVVEFANNKKERDYITPVTDWLDEKGIKYDTEEDTTQPVIKSRENIIIKLIDDEPAEQPPESFITPEEVFYEKIFELDTLIGDKLEEIERLKGDMDAELVKEIFKPSIEAELTIMKARTLFLQLACKVQISCMEKTNKKNMDELNKLRQIRKSTD